MTSRAATRVLLVGAGQTHLHVLRQARMLRRSGIELALLAPPVFDYSGLASAEATGAVSRGAGRIDVAGLAAEHDIDHTVGRAVGIDGDRRCVDADDGSQIPYDVVSFNVGSVVATGSMDVDPSVLAVKPLDRLGTLSSWLDDTDQEQRHEINVVGGGPTGLELSGHLSARLGQRAHIRVFERTAEVGASLPPGARRRARRRLAERGVEFRTGSPVGKVDVDHLEVGSERYRHHLAIIATGLVAPPIVAQLELGDAGGIPVRDTLQAVAHDDVYAVGDCASFIAQPLPKIGVYAVRQGPVLVASLLARRQGRPLPAFRPQRRVMQIVDLGAGTAVAARGRWWFEGPAASRLKTAIDRRWLDRYR